MKILALGDPHGKLPKNLSSIIRKEKIEIIVCLGDIAPIPIPKKGETFEDACKISEKMFKKTTDEICSYNIPVITLRGNTYTNTENNNKVTRSIFSPHKNLNHKKTGKFKIKKTNFIFFDLIYEKHNVRNPKGLKRKDLVSNKKREKKLNKMLKENKKIILLSHVPPYMILDKINSGKHVGSKILLNAIKKYQPRLVLCGHIHEAKGKAKIGKSEIHNIGCCGDYKIFNI